METRTLTVTQLNEYIKMMFDSQPLFRRVSVIGEISNFVDHRSGHLYFTLKDSGGVIRAVMFKTYAQKLRFKLENGMRVIISGNVSVFTRDGQYQLYAESIQPDGIGALYVAFEQLKAKLLAEGLFDESKKKPLPRYPERVGVVTSPTGAAIRDMINVAKRRFPLAEIVIYPAEVQGAEAPPRLIAGIEYFNAERNVDVIIIGRGGGSLEDLWAFNNENLARTVFASEIPVISAVGHEIDFTICDFVSDKRAPTPSAAAEIALPDVIQLRSDISSRVSFLGHLLTNKVKHNREKLAGISDSYVMRNADALLSDYKLSLDKSSEKLDKAMSKKLSDKKYLLREKAAIMSGLNPLAILSRGYSAVSDTESGKIVTGVTSLTENQNVSLRFSDGTAKAQILKIEVKNGK